MENYDSKGLSTGLELGRVFSDLELQYIVNRKQVFKNALKADNFLAAVLIQLSAYREANTVATQSAITKAGEIVRKELTKAYSTGVSSVDNSIEQYKKRGYVPSSEPTQINNIALDAGLISASFILSGLAITAQQDAINQVTQTASLVNSSSSDRIGEIDRVQQSLLNRGISGKTQSNGTHMSMDDYSELIIRSESAEVLRSATGERQAQYGNFLILTSAHPSACADCRQFMGTVLVNDVFAGGVPDGKHELLSNAISRGLYHYNCRCNFTDYIEGISNPNLYDYDKASVKKTAQAYAVEQQQRSNERMIREWKRRSEGSLSEEESAKALIKVKEWQSRQRALEDIAEKRNIPFYRQYSREQIGGETKPSNILVSLFGTIAA